MKECWYKALEGRKPGKGTCLDQLARGRCETCQYYRGNEHTENEKSVKQKEENDEF